MAYTEIDIILSGIISDWGEKSMFFPTTEKEEFVYIDTQAANSY